MTIGTERLDWLRYQMNQGWQVAGPVLERPASGRAAHQGRAFEFVLRHDQGCQVIAVPDCPELHSFLSEHALPVVSL